MDLDRKRLITLIENGTNLDSLIPNSLTSDDYSHLCSLNPQIFHSTKDTFWADMINTGEIKKLRIPELLLGLQSPNSIIAKKWFSEYASLENLSLNELLELLKYDFSYYQVPSIYRQLTRHISNKKLNLDTLDDIMSTNYSLIRDVSIDLIEPIALAKLISKYHPITLDDIDITDEMREIGHLLTCRYNEILVEESKSKEAAHQRLVAKKLKVDYEDCTFKEMGIDKAKKIPEFARHFSDPHNSDKQLPNFYCLLISFNEEAPHLEIFLTNENVLNPQGKRIHKRSTILHHHTLLIKCKLEQSGCMDDAETFVDRFLVPSLRYQKMTLIQLDTINSLIRGKKDSIAYQAAKLVLVERLSQKEALWIINGGLEVPTTKSAVWNGVNRYLKCHGLISHAYTNK